MLLTYNKTQKKESPTNWASLYKTLSNEGNVPNATATKITQQRATFRDMCIDLAQVKEAIRVSGFTPTITTIYTDVLIIPEQTNWLLESSGLVIFARRIEVAANCNIILDYKTNNSAQCILFASEMTGSLSVSTVKSTTEAPTIFKVTSKNVTPGIAINIENAIPQSKSLTLQQGFGFQSSQDMLIYLRNAFIFGSLLYDENSELALSIFLWVKGWAAQSDETNDLFYRSTSLVTLLSSEINATENGAVFVPYLTQDVYTSLSKTFAAAAGKYESDYMQLNTQKVLTEENIATAKTMVDNAQSEIDYVNALLSQAKGNYNNALVAVKTAQDNFSKQKRTVTDISINFKDIGIPEYEREQIIKAIFSLVTAIVTFGAGIAAMAIGDEAAAPAVAEGAVEGVEAVAEAAETGAEIAKEASEIGEVMKELKKLVEMLNKVYELAKSVMAVVGDINTATSQKNIIQKMQDTTNGADLSAASGWAVYKIKTDNMLQDPINKGIKYASAYKEALDILVVYGQALSASQLAVIKTSQQVAAITFQLHYAQEKKENLQKLVNQLKVGEAPILSMMQQFYQKYIDSKSMLFTALKSYQASYFYWALKPSEVKPRIIDPVTNLEAGLGSLTSIALDQATALDSFNPPPQPMEHTIFEIDDTAIIKSLQTTGEASWVLPLDNQEFLGLNRVRLSTIRIWLDGVELSTENDSVYIIITNSGNYLDRYANTNYQFNSKNLARPFKYKIAKSGDNFDWRFKDGSVAYIEIDGKVDDEVKYAYFEPTPFSEWSISLSKNNPGIDYSKVSKITMSFEGSTIGSILTK